MKINKTKNDSILDSEYSDECIDLYKSYSHGVLGRQLYGHTSFGSRSILLYSGRRTFYISRCIESKV